MRIETPEGNVMKVNDADRLLDRVVIILLSNKTGILR